MKPTLTAKLVKQPLPKSSLSFHTKFAFLIVLSAKVPSTAQLDHAIASRHRDVVRTVLHLF